MTIRMNVPAVALAAAAVLAAWTGGAQADHKSYIVCPDAKVFYDQLRSVEAAGDFKTAQRLSRMYCWDVTPPHILPSYHPMKRPAWAIPYDLAQGAKWAIMTLKNSGAILQGR